MVTSRRSHGDGSFLATVIFLGPSRQTLFGKHGPHCDGTEEERGGGMRRTWPCPILEPSGAHQILKSSLARPDVGIS